MDAVYDRLRLAGQVGDSEGPLAPFNSGLRNVNNVAHGFLLPHLRRINFDSLNPMAVCAERP